MEIGVAGETIIGGDVVEEDDENDGSVLEDDRCGICMEVVIDRGVLDCCQDWFCFECIDNWGTITNLCPLCQGEFQMITCLPVYDTIRSTKVEEDLLREEDWSIEGTTNTLSFPSYYIDENAVSCLDGDDCKIRSGSATLEEDPNLDTSIACDSCDLWYHAFCVGFDLECTSEDTWLCPRCVADETRQKSDVASLHPIDDSSISSGFLAETSLSGKVSISVADTGDTAVVVSLVGGYQQTEGPCEDFSSTVDVENDLKNGTFFLSKEMSVIQPNLEAHNPELALNCVENVLTDGTESQETREQHQHTPSDIPFSSVGKAEPDVNEDAVAVLGVKRNRTEHSNIPSPTEDKEKKPRIETAVSTKKVRLQQTNQMIPSEVQANNEDGKLRNNRDTEDAASDILSIVKGTHNKPHKGHTHRHLSDKVYKEKEKESGVRVKKIMRRASDDKESSVLVQKLREQIREAVRNKSSAALGKNLFDPELLAAFRGAVSRPIMDPVKKLSPSVIKVKKSILQKGKIRENLTKKIYATSRGRRRHGWDRDWEVEFWKHRCIQTVKPEKIDTLKSVLTLLRKGTDIVETEQSKEGTNPILSRLYLADASVFPRKNDIKPLSAFKADGSLEYNGKDIPNTAIKVAEKNKVLSRDVIPLLSNEGINSNLLSLKGKATSSKVHTYPHGSSVSVPGTSGANLQKETAGKSDNKKIDKKKWALEVLARKTATVGNRMAPEKQDLALVKGNYPLLAQLPIDMRPVLATSRHNKIPTSVRQAQLYRLAENFLKKADLPVLSRTAATELAIVDAINIEKEVADKSSSKIVYMNLCSQELLHRADKNKSTKAAAPKPPLPTISEDGSKQVSHEDSTDPAVEEALKAAGLLSDSPLGSPVNEMKGLDCHASTNIIEEGPDNVLEIDSNPDLDIYGDFDYDLEDEDYIGVSTVRLVPQQEEGDPKMKLVLSTLNLNVSGNGGRGPENGFTNNPSLPLETVREEGEDPSLVHHIEPSPIECEELYGPDKEPLIQKFPEMASRKLRGVVAPEALTKSIAPEGNCCKQNLEMNFAGTTASSGENSPSHSRTADNVLKDKKASYIEMDKKSDGKSSVQKKVELYIKEHIRPLCKSGLISTEHYRWAVAKTTEKVMKYHSKEKNANFLIKEGEKVKKLAEQYVEASQHKNQN